MRKEERLRLIQLDKEAEILRSQQEGKNNKQILQEINLVRDEKLAKGSVSIIDYFGKRGVYMLFNGLELVYIGESECIFSRIAQHVKQDVKRFTHFRIYELVENRNLRLKLEKKLIKRFRPKLNFVHNLGKLR